jgi:hypothetical protein
MNRNKAKLLTATGIFAMFISLSLLILDFVQKTNLSQIAAPLFFVSGIVLIIFSLAYYTEK